MSVPCGHARWSPRPWWPSSWRPPSWRNSGGTRCPRFTIIIPVTCAGSDADEGPWDPPGSRPGGIHGSREEFRGGRGRQTSRRGVRRRGRPDRGRYGKKSTGNLRLGMGAGVPGKGARRHPGCRIGPGPGDRDRGRSVSGRRKPAGAQGICACHLSRCFARRRARASGRRHVPSPPFRGGPGEGGNGTDGKAPSGLSGSGFPGEHGEPAAGPGSRGGAPAPLPGDEERPAGGRRREGKEKGVNEGILTVSLGDRSYDIFFANGVFPLFQEWVGRFFRGDAVFVVTDRTVSSIYGKDIQKWLSGIPHHMFSLPPGEGEKHRDTVLEIYSFLAGKGAGRDSLVVAFGGGVVGDLAGFAAATFLRGMPYVQIPTTLLAQVDSSVGGKTGYNLPEGKNLVGAFHQPRAVFIDPTFLLTLDDRNLRAGMAEVVKCAFAGVPSLLDSVAARAGSWRKMSGEAWIHVIRSAVAFKAGVVERDEREASTRRILNLGHTIGHALEQASGYWRLLHGEAVAMGMAWEAVFSRRQGVTPPEVERQMIDLLLAMGFTIDDPGIPLPAIAEAIGMDKKRMLSDIDMPLLTGPGSCVLRPISVSLLREDLPAIRDEIRKTLRERAAVGRKERRDPGSEEVRVPFPGQADILPPISALERRVVLDPRDVDAMIALAEAYRRAGNLAGAWETIKEALHQHPSSARAQHVAREIERNMKEPRSVAGESPSPLLEDVLILEEGAFELRPADRRADIPEEHVVASGPPAPGPPEVSEGTSLPDAEETVRTVTMASVYWDQGKQEEARRIIEGILRGNPQDPRRSEER